MRSTLGLGSALGVVIFPGLAAVPGPMPDPFSFNLENGETFDDLGKTQSILKFLHYFFCKLADRFCNESELPLIEISALS